MFAVTSILSSITIPSSGTILYLAEITHALTTQQKNREEFYNFLISENIIHRYGNILNESIVQFGSKSENLLHNISNNLLIIREGVTNNSLTLSNIELIYSKITEDKKNLIEELESLNDDYETILAGTKKLFEKLEGCSTGDAFHNNINPEKYNNLLDLKQTLIESENFGKFYTKATRFLNNKLNPKSFVKCDSHKYLDYLIKEIDNIHKILNKFSDNFEELDLYSNNLNNHWNQLPDMKDVKTLFNYKCKNIQLESSPPSTTLTVNYITSFIQSIFVITAVSNLNALNKNQYAKYCV